MNQQQFNQVNDNKTPASVNGYALASLILGIASLVLICLCGGLLTPVTAALSIVFAVVSKQGAPRMSGRAKAGMICAIIALVLFVLMMLLIVAILMDPIVDYAYFDEYYGNLYEEYGFSFDEFFPPEDALPAEGMT